MNPFEIRPFAEQDRAWALDLLHAHWGGPEMVSRGRLYRVDTFPGFVAVRAREPVGLATYRVDGEECELLFIESLAEGIGVGSALVEAVRRAAAEAGCRRLWLITTNDNLGALRFYQKRGFTLAALHANALARSRQLKPRIPLVGLDGIPLRDEIELELWL